MEFVGKILKRFISQNIHDLAFILWESINFICYAFPFFVFNGIIPSWTNGYDLISWFDGRYVEGQFIASISLMILSLSIIMIIFSLFSILMK